ncbi:MAG: elongation factor 1-beta [Candidatus Pacearchaeota archaeon]
MGKVLITYKIMPESPETNLEKLKKEIKENFEKNKGKVLSITEQPIAFGLKSLNFIVMLDENEESAPLEDSIKKIKEVSSVDVIDYRRALE